MTRTGAIEWRAVLSMLIRLLRGPNCRYGKRQIIGVNMLKLFLAALVVGAILFIGGIIAAARRSARRTNTAERMRETRGGEAWRNMLRQQRDRMQTEDDSL